MQQPASLFVLGSFVVACCARVDRLPQPGESLRAEAFIVEAGGKGFNLALGALRLGARVDGIFAIGTDLFSQLAQTAFTRSGLSPTMLRRIDTKTGSGIGFTDAHGENCLAVFPGANLLLSAQDIHSMKRAVQGAGIVVAQFEVGDEPILEAFALARDAGARTLLNPSPYRSVDPKILEHTSIMVLNRIEAAQIATTVSSEADNQSPESLDRLAADLLERGPDMVVVTLGRNGAIAYQRGRAPLCQPAFQIGAVDTLGAGDAFTAGLVVSLLEGRPLAESLERAAACGAFVCERAGVLDALPNLPDLDCFLGSHRNGSGP